MATALDVARFFLASNPENSINNLKLQKLVSYAQAVALAYLGQPLFPENIQMWDKGPVVPEVYDAYREYDNKPIDRPKLDLQTFTPMERFVLAGINDMYARNYTAEELRDKSHQDFPGEVGSREVVTQETLRVAFANNKLVEFFRRADRPVAKSSSYMPLGEFLDAVAN